jgi:hypothetical protein
LKVVEDKLTTLWTKKVNIITFHPYPCVMFPLCHPYPYPCVMFSLCHMSSVSVCRALLGMLSMSGVR